MSIPIIDISPLHSLSSNEQSPQEVQSTITQISSACQTHGFFAITNHSIPSSLLSTVCNASSTFFDLPKTIKQEVCMTDEYPYGYENIESLGIEHSNSSSSSSESNTNANRDSKETFSIGPYHKQSGMPSRRFPYNQSSFQRALTDYYAAMESLSRTLFRGFALALGLECDWFLREGVFDSAHQCALRVLNYPSLEYDNTLSSPVIRAGAHTDYGAMTILLSGGPGLQLCLSPNGCGGGDGEWMDVPHLDGAFIINLGDLMQRWTNDRWRSTLHRVVAVPDDSTEDGSGGTMSRSGRRQSVAFFVNMNGKANIVPFESCVDESNPAKYEAIRASDHLMQRHLRSMGKKK